MNFKRILIKLNFFLAKDPARIGELVKRHRGIKMGEGCEIYQNVSFGSEPYLIELGDNVRVTNGVKFTTHDGGIWVLRKLGLADNGDLFGKIVVGSNVHIGIDTVIMPGVTIGDNVIIGAGAIVTKDIPSNSVAVGVPAKPIKSIEEYYDKNKAKISYTKNLTHTEKRKYLKNKFNLNLAE